MRKFTAAMGLAAALAGFEAQAQTLQDALVNAYRDNPGLLVARARLRSVDERQPELLAAAFPGVDFVGSYGWRRFDDRSGTGFASGSSTTSPATASLTVTQLLYAGGVTRAALMQAQSNLEAERANLFATEQNTLLAAVTAYADVVREQAVLELNVGNERVLERQLEATRDRFAVGELTRTDVAQAESRLSRARADKIAAEGRLTDSRANYANVVGGPVGVLSPAEPLKDLPATLEEAIESGRKGSFEVRRARHSEDAARRGIRINAGASYPRVSVSSELSTDREQGNRRTSRSNDFSVTARVTMPLYDGGAVSARMRMAGQVASQRREEHAQAVRNAVEAATGAWQLLQSTRAQIRAIAASVAAAEIALEGVRQETDVGSRTVLDVLDAEQELLDARVSLVRAQHDELVATYRLRRAVGTLTAEDLGLPVELYDAGSRYDGSSLWWLR